MTRGVIFMLEDDAESKDLVTKTLEKEGFMTKCASSLKQARQELAKVTPDLFILDRSLPDGDGAYFCQELRTHEKTRHVPVLFLTAKRQLVEKVTGLKIGGDDYLTKPFQIEELVARVEALLRRASHPTQELPRKIEAKGIVLDEDKHECFVAGEAVELWPKEYELLRIFLQQPGRLLSREYLSEHVWALTYFETTHTIDTTVQRLRKKLGAKGKMIETVRGYGYRFNEK